MSLSGRFYQSVLNSQPWVYPPHALLQTAKREGVKVLSPSIQNSFFGIQALKNGDVVMLLGWDYVL